MSTVYDWRAEGDFDDERAPHPDAVRLALCQVAEGRLPTLGTLKRALGISGLRALAVRDHLAHLLAERDLAERSSGTAEAPRAGAGGEDATAGATAPDAAVPARTAESALALPAVPDPVCPRALDVFAADLAAGRTPSLRGIMRRLHVGAPRAKRIRGFLAAHVRRAA